MTRKFFRSSINELEALFKDHKNDINLLQALQEELTYRKTQRATRLGTEVKERLERLRSGTPSIGPDTPKAARLDQVSSGLSHDQPSHTEEVPTGKRPDRTEPPQDKPGPSITPPPPITNKPEEIISAWTALEVLSPPAYVRPQDLVSGERGRVVHLDRSSLPWERGEHSRPNNRLYYQVILGSIKMELAIGQLIARYGDTRPEKPGVRGKAAIGVVVVDQRGRLVESPAVSISSFAWGVMAALRGELADLARWPQVESQLVESIETSLFRTLTAGSTDEEARSRPLSSTALFSTYEALVHDLGLPMEWVEPPEFALRSYVYYKDPNPPEQLLLNSFFLKDLDLARALLSKGLAPQNLRRYLGVDRPESYRDLLGDNAVLAEAVRPAITPLSRWPGNGRHPLVLLQQAAVNLGFRETRTGGMLGINGPPGTGKTTLLRDFVAGVVAERAEAMTRWDDPERAFDHTGQRLRAGNSWIHLYQLNASLRGYEMVVASSNNKAVENVSAELPTLDAIAEDAPALRYFKTLSDALHQSNTWGAIAAVLGNVQNRSWFKQMFWWDDDNGLNSYLWAAAGSVREIETKDPETGEVRRRTPRIIEKERPPLGRREALDRWNRARKKFLNALDKSRKWQTWLEDLRATLDRLPALVLAEISAKEAREAAIEHVRRLKATGATSDEGKVGVGRELQHVAEELSAHALSKPWRLARLFRTRRAREWRELQQALLQWQKAETVWQTASDHHQKLKDRFTEARDKYGVLLADDAFFALEHKARHQMTPWFPPTAQRLRDEVFISAMEVHRAFIDAAAKPLRHNLGALMNVFTTQTLPGAEKQALLPDLWASLFLVVPLVSTTFASVNRMLGKLPTESLGWLLLDEAGQALPQAAVGALLRTRRAVIVGDPAQIEPVVVLPDTLTHAVCHRFGVDPDRYAAPLASVQTLADAASAYTSEFQTKIGSRTVGVPLLVHRRCSEPMFGVSNAVAYAGLMVCAKLEKPSTIREVLGPSSWIHVEGSSDDKWCQQEGAEVLRLLRQLARAGAKPDLYIITPFVIVADRLRQAVRDSGVLNGWIEENDWRWVNERIGTVHTAQGREAEAVIFVLGATRPAQTGARNWAGGRPNLLNVAVSRAKEAIYVIGNRRLWSEAGFFQELDRRLP